MKAWLDEQQALADLLDEWRVGRATVIRFCCRSCGEVVATAGDPIVWADDGSAHHAGDGEVRLGPVLVFQVPGRGRLETVALFLGQGPIPLVVPGTCSVDGSIGEITTKDAVDHFRNRRRRWRKERRISVPS